MFSKKLSYFSHAFYPGIAENNLFYKYEYQQNMCAIYMTQTDFRGQGNRKIGMANNSHEVAKNLSGKLENHL